MKLWFRPTAITPVLQRVNSLYWLFDKRCAGNDEGGALIKPGGMTM